MYVFLLNSQHALLKSCPNLVGNVRFIVASLVIKEMDLCHVETTDVGRFNTQSEIDAASALIVIRLPFFSRRGSAEAGGDLAAGGGGVSVRLQVAVSSLQTQAHRLPAHHGPGR